MSNKPAYLEIIDLFARHGLAPPPWRLRDELVGWLLAYREAALSSAKQVVGDSSRDEP